MKIILFALSFIFISSCHSLKKMNTEEFKNIRLHDIWALEMIQGKKVDANLTHQTPYIEIHVRNKKIYGNNGCTEISGNVVFLDNEQIEFSAFSIKEKECIKMEISNQFQALMKKVKYYQLDGLKLFFLNKKKKEILKFKKVD